MRKPILLIDFDGVLHSYKTGWQGATKIPDLPVPGALQFLVEATHYFRVNIYSSRSNQWSGKRAMKKWLFHHYIKISGIDEKDRWKLPESSENCPDWWFNWIAQTAFADPWEDEVKYAISKLLKLIKFPTKKPAAFLTIDDRCFCFKGTFPDTAELLKFMPWHKGD